MKDPLTFSRFRFWALVGVIVPLLSCLVTWAIGFLLVSSGSGGFPIPWRELVFRPLFAICPTIGETACRLYGIRIAQVDWLSFVIDVLFYVGVGYSILLAYARTGVLLEKLMGRSGMADGAGSPLTPDGHESIVHHSKERI
ncbi:hypothetical protein E6H35_07205 [Candidatus Bathyarchaeota archaeon]|nr:MAG: hypothetical protein E6H35_07205 [Candidatus Bathyarchaeota archaeon]